ncbi:MAG: ferredoxin:glutaredoxin reductase [Candidatus Thermoplasmatota archaeon]|nr:ferredoxin:glutaredoxin reductase [Candidatus Thermoplasmatota archaeon]
MVDNIRVTSEKVEGLYRKLDRDARNAGYNLNPDTAFTRELVEGLLVNEKRYGYWACPCRVAEGDIEKDRDIVCPCDYRDPDLAEFGSCFCALYVDDEIKNGNKKARSIPERRPDRETREHASKEKEEAITRPQEAGSFKPRLPVWRCTVCGYLAAREEPPLVCPICKAKKDRFERFL